MMRTKQSLMAKLGTQSEYETRRQGVPQCEALCTSVLHSRTSLDCHVCLQGDHVTTSQK